MSQVWLIADRSSAVIQEGQPAAQQAAWLLDVPDDSTALDTATAFAEAQGLQIGTVVRMLDLAAYPDAIQTFQLSSEWVPQ